MIPLHDDNPTSLKPVVTVALIVLCVLVFVWELSLGQALERAIYSFGAIPAVLFGTKALNPELVAIPAGLTVISSMFLHGGWMHLIGNMLYLWIFGNNIEDSMGHIRYIVFYVVCGIAAGMAHALLDPTSTVPMIGASGAVSGVLGAYLLLFPRAQVYVAIPLGFFIHAAYLPAMFVLGFWFVLQLVSSAFAPSGQGGIAFFAHIGGFAAGMVLIPLFKYRHVKFFNPPHNRRRWTR
jgi:membrane associated rhomboid family serine protease